MSSYQLQSQSYPSHAAPPPSYNPMAAVMQSSAPAGTFLPGTKVQVGNHRVVVEKYLSEGGFAHVYLVRLPQPVDGSDIAVLKRVAVPDKVELANMRTEVETMKKLKGHRHIVKYFDSHASQLQGGGYEVFLLMEYCAGGGLIDFMNTRLQNRLTEPEIVKIFSDVAEGVACMHYLKPPLLHRDLKVENVLISRSANSLCYKLCDFGSAAPPRPAAQTAAEGRLIEEDIQRHTTLQYRSPEMIDVYRKQPIDEKSDIWALGVLLYKLCYYTTPFEDVGQMAILNASFKFPAYPPFSDKLKLLIAAMLKENPQKRPNIYEVLSAACHMQGKEVPIRDIYSGRSTSEPPRQYQELPQPKAEKTARVGAVFSPPVQETQIIPEIAPMRRGRPAKPGSQHNSTKPSPSPFRGPSADPFAALDGGRAKSANVDELSNRFPTLDEFQLLHEKGDKFDFEPTVVVEANNTEDDDFARRLTHALADEAFVKRPSPQAEPVQEPVIEQQQQKRSQETKPGESPNLREEPARGQTTLYQPIPKKPSMISTGTMTSPSPTPGLSEVKSSSRPIYRFPPPEHERQSSSQPRTTENEREQQFGQSNNNNNSSNVAPSPTRAFFKPQPTPKSSSDKISHGPASSRPSLEGLRPSHAELNSYVSRSKSVNSKSRPLSVFAGSKYDFPERVESARASLDLPRPKYDDGAALKPVRSDVDCNNIPSDIDYLRAKEEEMNRKHEKRPGTGSKHVKRSSLSKSFSGTKTLLTGRFGEAFRRFESHGSVHKHRRPPSPVEKPAQMTMVTDSEVTHFAEQGGLGDDYDDDNGDISPETRRELERRRLSQEEKRVANAAAEYRRLVAERGQGGWRAGSESPQSPAIQSKVRSLFQENSKPPPRKTASGYGRYTDSNNTALQATQSESSRPEPNSNPVPLSRTPGSAYGVRNGQTSPAKDNNREVSGVSPGVPKEQTGRPASSAAAQSQRTGPRPVPPPRPMAPPKPKNLRVGSGLQDVSQPASRDSDGSPLQSPTSPDNWETGFSRRFPSLSRFEMVETEIEISSLPSLRTREV